MKATAKRVTGKLKKKTAARTEKVKKGTEEVLEGLVSVVSNLVKQMGQIKRSKRSGGSSDKSDSGDSGAPGDSSSEDSGSNISESESDVEIAKPVKKRSKTSTTAKEAVDWNAVEAAIRNIRSSFQTFSKFCGDDPNPRVNAEHYRDFKRRIANVQDNITVPPECFEKAMRMCIIDFLGGHVAKTVINAIKRRETMAQILGTLDIQFNSEYSLGVRLLETLQGEFVTDSTISQSAPGTKCGQWIEFFDIVAKMSPDEVYIELMKSQCSGKETLQHIASLPKSITPVEFTRSIMEFHSKRLNSLTNTGKAIPVVQTTAVVTSSHKRGDMKRTRISKFNSGPGKDFKLGNYWTKILKGKGVNVKDMANMKLAKQRMSKGECLYCGAKGHTVLQCPVPAVVDGCLPTA